MTASAGLTAAEAFFTPGAVPGSIVDVRRCGKPHAGG